MALNQSLKISAQEYFKHLQDVICRSLETADGTSSFAEDNWTHAEHGGGRTRVLQNGSIFEKAGVNFSAVTSTLTRKLAERMQITPQPIFATGISIVLHPSSPMIPTVHMNLRYLELQHGDVWFGGGIDLTPYYFFEEDARHFHQTLKRACDKHDTTFYPRFKKWCDEYFFITHRNEARGIGGIFFDYLKENPEKTFRFVQEIGNIFLNAYLPIVQRRRNEQWGEREKTWQLIRRGRYVEFNLVYDRGTLFGLDAGGRIESVLMSLPSEVRWQYDHNPDVGSREDKLLEILRQPREWA